MHVCLFDIDGTLLSSGGAGKGAMEAALGTAFGVPERSDGVPFSGRTDRAITRDLFRLHRIEHSPANWERFVADYLRHLPDFMVKKPGRVYPGVGSLLEQLSAREDVCVGLLTGNLRDGARIKLGHFDLYRHFELGGFGDHHFERDDVAREALAIVRSHLEGRSADLDEMWVIGDTPLDIRCARAIHARVAAVATGIHSLAELAADRPDLLFADLSDPAPLLERIL